MSPQTLICLLMLEQVAFADVRGGGGVDRGELGATMSGAPGAVPRAKPPQPSPPPTTSQPPPRTALGIDLLVGISNIDNHAEDNALAFSGWLGAGRRWDGALARHVAWVAGGDLVLGLTSFGPNGINVDLQLRGGLRLGNRHSHLMGFVATGGDRFVYRGTFEERVTPLAGYGCVGSLARLGARVALGIEGAWCIRAGDVVTHEERFGAWIELWTWNVGLRLTNFDGGGADRVDGEMFGLFLGKAL